MIRTPRIFVPILVLLALMGALVSCAKHEAEIKVGEFGSLTGSDRKSTRLNSSHT